MELLIIWIATIIASFYMEITNELRMFKDVADAGYKVDVSQLSNFGKQLNPDASKVNLLSMLILGVNMLTVFQRAIQYNNVRPFVLDQLHVIDALEEMSELEKEEYAKNPTGFNAVMIILNKKLKESKNITITIKEDNVQSEIKFEMGTSLKDITILSVSGPAARLTEEEQKEKIIETWKEVVKSGMDKYGDRDALIKAFCSNEVIDLSKSKNDKKDENDTEQMSEEKEIFSNELDYEIPENEDIQPNTPDIGPTLSKRIK